MSDPEMCACGQPLHYSDPKIREVVEALVRTLGPNIRLSVGARSWLVPRHYIALHGIKSAELPLLGFEEVTGAV